MSKIKLYGSAIAMVRDLTYAWRALEYMSQHEDIWMSSKCEGCSNCSGCGQGREKDWTIDEGTAHIDARDGIESIMSQLFDAERAERVTKQRADTDRRIKENYG